MTHAVCGFFQRRERRSQPALAGRPVLITRNYRQQESGRTRAFTLVEMLVVMLVIITLIAITVPAIRGMKGAGDMNKAVYDIAGLLEQARAYALANNTYVYFGLGEFDSSKPDSGAQTTGTGSVGRIAIAVVATRDGTRAYSPYTDDVYTAWSTNYTATTNAISANLIMAGRLQRFDNLHLIDLDPTQIPASGPTHRPAVTDTIFRLGNSDSQTATPFSYPVTAALGSGNYVFTRVIQFDPQGQARSLPKTATSGSFHVSGLPDRIEIALQPTNGPVAAPTPANQQSGNFCVLQIDGMTGITTIYRP